MMLGFIDFKKLMDMPMLASEHGAHVDSFIIYVHWLMAILFIGWLAYFGYAVWRFRASKHPKADRVGVTGHTSSWLEIAIVLVEVVLLVGFAIPMWAKVASDFPTSDDNPVEVQVIGQQFAWNFRYPGPDGVFGNQDIKYVTADNRFGVDPNDPSGADDFENPGEMVVPVNTPVITHISSLDVIHSFAVKPMRITQDAIPGLRIPTHFIPNRTGNYQIICAQLCGSGHYGMKGAFTVVTQEEYDAWVAERVPEAGGDGSESSDFE
jgi:cytochrome c oxidase subunit 2